MTASPINSVSSSCRVAPAELRSTRARRLLDNVDTAATRMRVCDLNAVNALSHASTERHATAVYRRLCARADRYRRYMCRALDEARALLDRGAL